MKKNVMILALAACTAACSEEGVGEITVPQTGYTIPQGGNAKADELATEVLERYDSYLLYEYDSADAAWAQVNTSTLGDAIYRYVLPQQGETLDDFVAVVRSEVLDRYSTEYLRRALPKRIFLCDSLLLRGIVGGFFDGVEVWNDMTARYMDNQIAISRPKPSWDAMTDDARKAWTRYVNTTLLEYSHDAGTITIDDEFFAISDYSQSPGSSASTASVRRMGFITNDKTGSDWAKTSYSLSRDADVAAYIAAIVYRSEENWEGDMRYDKIARKRELMEASLEASGINIELLKK